MQGDVSCRWADRCGQAFTSTNWSFWWRESRSRSRATLAVAGTMWTCGACLARAWRLMYRSTECDFNLVLDDISRWYLRIEIETASSLKFIARTTNRNHTLGPSTKHHHNISTATWPSPHKQPPVASHNQDFNRADGRLIPTHAIRQCSSSRRLGRSRYASHYLSPTAVAGKANFRPCMHVRQTVTLRLPYRVQGLLRIYGPLRLSHPTDRLWESVKCKVTLRSLLPG